MPVGKRGRNNMSKTCALPKSVFPLKFKVKSPVHALQLARELIRPYRNWTVGFLAVRRDPQSLPHDTRLQWLKDMSEFRVKPKSAKAEAFCALGALKRVNTKHAKKAERYLAQAASIILGKDPDHAATSDILQINDSSKRDYFSHRQVLKMFTRAIKLAEKAEGK
jgi:hypothetical protein